jgi:hypothetical protein
MLVNKKTLTPYPKSKQNKAQTKKATQPVKTKKVLRQMPTTTQRYNNEKEDRYLLIEH